MEEHQAETLESHGQPQLPQHQHVFQVHEQQQQPCYEVVIGATSKTRTTESEGEVIYDYYEVPPEEKTTGIPNDNDKKEEISLLIQTRLDRLEEQMTANQNETSEAIHELSTRFAHFESQLGAIKLSLGLLIKESVGTAIGKGSSNRNVTVTNNSPDVDPQPPTEADIHAMELDPSDFLQSYEYYEEDTPDDISQDQAHDEVAEDSDYKPLSEDERDVKLASDSDSDLITEVTVITNDNLSGVLDQDSEITEEKNTDHECRICLKFFASSRKLRAHICNEHIAAINVVGGNSVKKLNGSQGYCCPICQLNFATRKEFYIHCIKKHEDYLRPFKCLICTNPKSYYINSERLAEHYILYHETPDGIKPKVLRSKERASVGPRPVTQKCIETVIVISENTSESAKQLTETGEFQRFCKKVPTEPKESRKNLRHKCPDCGQIFPVERLLEKHVSQTHNHKLHICEKCGKDFYNKTNLTYHVKNVHEGIKDFQCSECGECFYQNYRLKNHMMLHEDSDCFTCKDCGLGYKRLSDLNRHLRLHNGKHYECEICKRKHVSQSELKAHLTSHSQERPFKCSYCPLVFKLQTAKRNHEKSVHTLSNTFTCEICGKSFNWRANLALHFRRVHTTERPYKCHLCPKTFASSSGKKEHLFTHSTKLNNFICRICCEVTFKRTSGRRRHEIKCAIRNGKNLEEVSRRDYNYTL